MADMANRNRTHQIKFYLDDEELDKFLYKVTKSCLSKSEYIRKCILGRQIKVVNINLLEEYLAELGKIGSNLNQLTRLAHIGQLNYISSCRLDQCLSEMDTIKYKIQHYIEKH